MARMSKCARLLRDLFAQNPALEIGVRDQAAPHIDVPEYRLRLEAVNLPAGIGSVKRIATTNDLARIFRRRIGMSDREEMAVLYLASDNKIAGLEVVGVGSYNSMGVTPREIFRGAVINGTEAIVLSHNHPSGNLKPTKDDIEFTKKMVEGGNLLNIRVLDHLIVSHGEDYTSLRVYLDQWK